MLKCLDCSLVGILYALCKGFSTRLFISFNLEYEVSSCNRMGVALITSLDTTLASKRLASLYVHSCAVRGASWPVQ